MPSGYLILQKEKYAAGDFVATAIDASYIQQIREWRNQQLHILRQNQPVSPEEQVTYFNTHVFSELGSKQPSQVLFNYFYKGDFIGYGGIVHISYTDLTGEISFLLGPEQNSSFYETAFLHFLQLMDEVAFADLKLEKLFTETFDTRIENVSVLERAGYTREGVLHSHKVINGKRSDVYLHGKLKTIF